jgi:hypothetical protein
METSELVLETRGEQDRTGVFEGERSTVLLAPVVSEDYWEYRVGLTEGQAVVGFPKFGTIGIGFAVEGKSWNTNLPYVLPAEQIVDHIWTNRGSTVRNREVVLAAVRLIQAAAFDDQLKALYPITTTEAVESRERLIRIREQILGDEPAAE